LDTSGANTINIGNLFSNAIQLGNSGSTTTFSGTLVGVQPSFSGLTAGHVVVALPGGTTIGTTQPATLTADSASNGTVNLGVLLATTVGVGSNLSNTTVNGGLSLNLYGYTGATAGAAGSMTIAANTNTGSNTTSGVTIYSANASAATGLTTIYGNNNASGVGTITIANTLDTTSVGGTLATLIPTTLHLGTATTTTIGFGNSGSTTTTAGAFAFGTVPTGLFSGLTSNSVVIALTSSTVGTAPSGTANFFASSSSGTAGTLTIKGNSSTGQGLVNIQGGGSANFGQNQVTIEGGPSATGGPIVVGNTSNTDTVAINALSALITPVTINMGTATTTTINIGRAGSTTTFSGTVNGITPSFSGLTAGNVAVATSTTAIGTTQPATLVVDSAASGTLDLGVTNASTLTVGNSSCALTITASTGPVISSATASTTAVFDSSKRVVSSTSQSTVSVDSASSGTVNVGTSAATTINIGTGGAAVNVGDAGGTGQIIIQTENTTLSGLSGALVLKTIGSSGNIYMSSGNTTGNIEPGFTINCSAATSGTAFQIMVGTGATPTAYLAVSTGGVWQSTSDERSKEEITDCEYGWDWIMKQRPVSYYMRGSKNALERTRQHGFLAQKMIGGPGHSRGPRHDFGDGLGYEPIHGMGMTELIAPLFRTVQEMTRYYNHEIESLKREIKY
jgi:hypothetical protein